MHGGLRHVALGLRFAQLLGVFQPTPSVLRPAWPRGSTDGGTRSIGVALPPRRSIPVHAEGQLTEECNGDLPPSAQVARSRATGSGAARSGGAQSGASLSTGFPPNC